MNIIGTKKRMQPLILLPSQYTITIFFLTTTIYGIFYICLFNSYIYRMISFVVNIDS